MPFSPVFTLNGVMFLLGRKIESFMLTTTPGKKYLVQVLLRVPLLFFIHLLLLLGPKSDYVPAEVVLCIVRFTAAFLALALWTQNVKNLLTTYCLMTLNLFVSWMMEKVYCTLQNEALGQCSDVWIPWSEKTWWTPILGTLVLKSVYLMTLFTHYDIDSNLRLPVTGVLMFPYLLCIYFVTPLVFWLYKNTILLACFVQIGKTGNESCPPGRWYARDMLAVFGVLYYLCCIIFDMAFVYNLSYVMSFSYLTKSIGVWCTTFAIVLALAALFSITANCAAVLSLWFVKGEVDALAIMNSPLGNRAFLTVTIFCIEAGILFAAEDTRSLNMENVLLLTLYVILQQVWDLTEEHFLFVVKRRMQWVSCLRIALFSFLLLTTSTYITVNISPKIGVDVWLMLNLSGNISMLVRAAVVTVEIILVSITWYVNNGLDKLEDAIYFVRLSKTSLKILCEIMLAYYRFYAPFFNTWSVIRGILIVGDVSLLTSVICKREWTSFQARRRYVQRVNGLSDATPVDIDHNNDDCAVCHVSITNGKKLPCSHLFHTNCLRKWFQIRITCPLCRAEIFNGNYDIPAKVTPQ